MADEMNDETYLGDGLYVSWDGFMFTLRAPRETGDHWVGLEPSVLKVFLAYVERIKAQIAEAEAMLLERELQEEAQTTYEQSQADQWQANQGAHE